MNSEIMQKTVPLNEIFYSLQGEGPSVGIPSVFIRLQGCNLNCSFCDTLYAVRDNPNAEVLTVQELFDKVKVLLDEHLCNNVVITGGEPLLYKEQVFCLAKTFVENGCFVEVETNGTIPLDFDYTSMLMAVQWNVSPKQDHLNYSALATFVNRLSNFKFVIDPDAENLDEWMDTIKKFVTKHNSEYEVADYVYLMPQCKNIDEYNDKISRVFRLSKLSGFKTSTRMQILFKDLK